MWTDEQQLAISKRNSNILVSASAGSGKTAILVERVINKVINEKIDIDKILVVTFTNSAATELKERLLLAIYDALKKKKDDKFLKRQLTYINRASITTIHSFCLDIIRSNFQEAGIDPNFKICDETEANILKTKAITNVLEEEYIKSNEDENSKDNLYNLLELFGSKDENLVTYILKIYSYIQSFAYPFNWLKEQVEKYNIENVVDLYETDFGKTIYEDTINKIDVLIKREEKLANTARENEDFTKYVEVLENDIYLLKQCVSVNEKSWDKLYENLRELDFKKAPRYSGQNLELKEILSSFRSKVLKEEIKKLKLNIYEKTDTILADQKIAYSYIKYICDFVIKFKDKYDKLKIEKNYIDFNDIEHLALKLLVKQSDENNNEIKYTEVAYSLREKFKEVYTDEYQDISFIQEAILASVSGDTNRFMVGDIKQSIYRFRQAMPSIFNDKYDTYTSINSLEEEVKNCKIILAKNFRSRKQVIESINSIFEKIMSKDLGECSYEKEETLKYGASYEEDGLNYKTEINILDINTEDGDNTYNEDNEDEVEDKIKDLKNFEIEALYVSAKIKELMTKYKVYNVKDKKFEPIKYKDIVILLRSIKDKGKILEDTLKNANIPVFCDTSSNLFESEEIYLVISLLKVLDNVYQDIHMVSIMYSIIGNFTLDELVYIRSVDKKSRVYDNLVYYYNTLAKKEEKSEFESKLYTKICDFLDLLNYLKVYAKQNSISSLILKIYDVTNVYRQYILDNNFKQRMANLDLLVEVALKCEEQNILTLSEYIAYVDNLKDKVDGSSASAKIIGENENVVRIMTIHKSKGLEFPFVILCDTAKKYNLKDATNTVTLHHNLGIGINVVNEKYKVAYPSVIKQAIKNKIERETKSEELRMLYVALTRAREKLIVFSTVKNYDKFNLKQIVIYDKEKIIPSVVLNNNSYFENINMALKNSINDELFDFNIINVSNENIDNLMQNDTNEVLNIDSVINSNNVFKKEEIKEEVEKVKENIEYKYKYNELVNTPSRVSVSELKKAAQEDNIFVQNFVDDSTNIQDKYKLPSILQDVEEKYTSARKGTLIHFILENLDMKQEYTSSSLNEYIKDLVNNGVISKKDSLYINVEKILKFLDTKVAKEIKISSNVKKEQEFVLKEESISNSIIQGIIDLYYINKNGNVILIDFKTDKLDKDQEYIKRYKKQLQIYKIALEKLLNKKVEKSYIYSFYLDRVIEVEIDE